MSETTGVDRTDPYTLTPEGIKDPPVGWKASFRCSSWRR
jgi:hypothetical protein